MLWFADREQQLAQIGAIIRIWLILRQWLFFATGCVRRVLWIVGNRWAQPFGSYLLSTCLEGLSSLYSVVSEANAVEDYIADNNDIHNGPDCSE